MDKFPNSSVWYLHLSRVEDKFINDGRGGKCIPIKRGDTLGYSGNFYGSVVKKRPVVVLTRTCPTL